MSENHRPTVDEMRAALDVVKATPQSQMTRQGVTREGGKMCPGAWFYRALREQRPEIAACEVNLIRVEGAYDYAPTKRDGRRAAIRALRQEIERVAEAGA